MSMDLPCLRANAAHVGGVFNTVNPSVYENAHQPGASAKARCYAEDLQDWARYVGVRIGSRPVFPVNSIKAMRGAFVAEEVVASYRTPAVSSSATGAA